jgi:formamidopyrimidine-DNA glycosylase
MPELPEVETARRELERAAVGRLIARVAAVDDRIVFHGVTARRFGSTLRGRRIEAVRRRGKHLWFVLDQRPFPAFHFGMTGGFDILAGAEAGDPRHRFWKAELGLDDGTRLVFHDVRRFGRVRLQKDPEAEPPMSLLGFDPLLGLPPPVELARLLARRRAPLKAVLLDQSLFAGVGNWIADEVLYQARLSPHRLASSLSLDEVRRLRERLHSVVTRAVDVGARSERFPRTWLFHHRWGRVRDARTGRDEAIVHDTVGGRTTAWVPAVQR